MKTFLSKEVFLLVKSDCDWPTNWITLSMTDSLYSAWHNVQLRWSRWILRTCQFDWTGLWPCCKCPWRSFHWPCNTWWRYDHTALLGSEDSRSHLRPPCVHPSIPGCLKERERGIKKSRNLDLEWSSKVNRKLRKLTQIQHIPVNPAWPCNSVQSCTC